MEKAFPYQVTGADFLAAKNYALLADEMGLGKTRQVIQAMDLIQASRAIIVCPSIARINWLREFEMWSSVKRNYQILQTLKDTPLLNHTVICSFDYVTENFEKFKFQKWDVLVVDESHFLKSPKTKRSQAVLGTHGLLHFTKRCWLISGTPAPNHSGELWIPLYTLGATKLSYSAFLSEYCILQKTNFGLKVLGTKPNKLPELKSLLSKIMLRRLKKDVMKELPPIFFTKEDIEPGPVDLGIQASFTQYLVPVDKRKELEHILQKQNDLLNTVHQNMVTTGGDFLNVLNNLAQSVSTLRRYVGLQKCPGIIERINNIMTFADNIEKVVIFAVHRDVIETLRHGLRKHHPVVLYGNTDPAKRQRNIDRFQNNPRYKIFIGNVQAAGTAVTLTAAHHVFFAEVSWTPGDNAQAIMRCHRIGQENPVYVKFFCLDNSLDQKIMHVIKRKTKMLTDIFG